VCDLETSRMGAPYIYDISTLRVKDQYVNVEKIAVCGYCSNMPCGKYTGFLVWNQDVCLYTAVLKVKCESCNKMITNPAVIVSPSANSWPSHQWYTCRRWQVRECKSELGHVKYVSNKVLIVLVRSITGWVLNKWSSTPGRSWTLHSAIMTRPPRTLLCSYLWFFPPGIVTTAWI